MLFIQEWKPSGKWAVGLRLKGFLVLINNHGEHIMVICESLKLVSIYFQFSTVSKSNRSCSSIVDFDQDTVLFCFRESQKAEVIKRDARVKLTKRVLNNRLI